MHNVDGKSTSYLILQVQKDITFLRKRKNTLHGKKKKRLWDLKLEKS